MNVDNCTVEKALNYCIKQKLYSATDFSDALKHFKELMHDSKTNTAVILPTEIKPIVERDNNVIKAKPEIRDIQIYHDIMMGGNK